VESEKSNENIVQSNIYLNELLLLFLHFIRLLYWFNFGIVQEFTEEINLRPNKSLSNLVPESAERSLNGPDLWASSGRDWF
jgi:hypothetical protein